MNDTLSLDTLHVGNIGPDMTDQQLHDLFSPAGPVVSAHVMTDRQTNVSRGFGLVQMASYEATVAAAEAVHGSGVGGHVLTVRQLPPRAPGWAGGNDQGGRNRSHGQGGGNGGSRW